MWTLHSSEEILYSMNDSRTESIKEVYLDDGVGEEALDLLVNIVLLQLLFLLSLMKMVRR